MNEKLMEIFAREIIASLPKEKRRIYQFIESEEDKLAQRSKTKDQFLTLLKEHSPYKLAANCFQVTIGEIYSLMHEIENEINSRLDTRIQKKKWIDYTEMMGVQKEGNAPEKLFFLFLS
ncbi:hypothetical protein ACOI1C_08645 [Bacillus sp. DJP31]|uniref:hypothetical protein n=1 Tax=Bacillus sp. DJP31 TaxID=3409789 RepID=UPI003BB5BB5D